MNPISKNQPGFTLIETIVGMVLVAVISVGIGSLILTATRSWVLISGRESAVHTASIAMNRITAEMRSIMKPTAIEFPGSSECRFADLGGNLITFRQDGVNLLRNADILATGLANPGGLIFTYLGRTGEVTSFSADIRSIQTRITLSSGTQLLTMESSARIRNF